MTEPDNVVIQHLRPIREQLDTLNVRQLEMMQRLGGVEVSLAGADTGTRRDRDRVDQKQRHQAPYAVGREPQI